jgi:hypothetical protein
MFSLYARWHDTITFTCIGYREYSMVVQDTLGRGSILPVSTSPGRHTMIPAVIVIPRLGNIRAEIMADRPVPTQEMINASNNLRMGVYQGLTTPLNWGIPATIMSCSGRNRGWRHMRRGRSRPDQMIGLSPLILIPLIQRLASGPPEDPVPPAPHISAREMEHLRRVHDSLIFRR